MRDVLAAAVVVVLLFVIAVGLTVDHWSWLARGEASTSAVVRNVALAAAAPIGIFLAVWRSIVADRHARAAEGQAETAQTQADTARIHAETTQQQVTLHETEVLQRQLERAEEMLSRDDLLAKYSGISSLFRLALGYPG